MALCAPRFRQAWRATVCDHPTAPGSMPGVSGRTAADPSVLARATATQIGDGDDKINGDVVVVESRTFSPVQEERGAVLNSRGSS